MAKDKCEDKSCLEKLKEDYKKIQEKYRLPSFDSLNRDFQIEKVAECETDYLIREIRKGISDKFSNYLQFIEVILNPVNAPLFIFSVIKSIGVDEKNKLSETYKEIVRFEVILMKLDIEFSEEKEAEFIRDSYEAWQKIKKDILEVVEIMEENLDNKFEVNNKGYFG
ncbi:MAG: hypothetical protein WC584_02350 [Candidatus Pacearchaeota archaeon]